VKKLAISDWLLGLAFAALICGILLMAPTSNCPADFANNEGQCAIYQKEWSGIVAGTHFTDWILAVAALGRLAVLCIQAAIYSRQRELMAGQLKATEVAADAALAALARPWIFIEEVSCNKSDWLNETSVNLTGKFRLTNYGNAPAHISSLRVALFAGPHCHNGIRNELRTERIIDFPQAETLEQFITLRARQCEADDGLKSKVFNKIVRQNESVPVNVYGQPALDQKDGDGIRPENTADIYMIGRMYYSVPSQGIECMTFSMLAHPTGVMQIFRDYSPFNEIRKI
jgi:hypothetical protein